MNRIGTGVLTFLVLVLAASMGTAGDYDWMEDFNLRAEADPLEFRGRLEARFKVGALEIDTVFRHARGPADCYMLFRLGEIARQPIGRVIECYESEKGKGWGAMAKRLGIKPGSGEFHALKQGQDLYTRQNGGKSKGKSKSKGKYGKS